MMPICCFHYAYDSFTCMLIYITLYLYCEALATTSQKKNKKTGENVMETMKATDEGGPTAHFLSETWKQMGDLKVTFPVSQKNRVAWSEVSDLSKDYILKVMHGEKRATIFEKSKKGNDFYRIQYDIEKGKEFEGTKATIVSKKELIIVEVGIRLFEIEDISFIPITNDSLSISFDKLSKSFPITTLEKVKEKARLIYRALGRIMLFCIINNQNVIASHVLPRLFRNSKCSICLPINEEVIILHILPPLLFICSIIAQLHAWNK